MMRAPARCSASLNGFVPDSGPYFQAADTYPLKGMGVPVRDLLSANAVELGL